MKWAIREAVDVYFKAKSPFKLGARMIRAGEPILIFDTVQTSAIEIAAEISYVTGGRGNARILSFEGDKTLAFNFEEALLSNEGLAILAGADLIPARNKHLPGASPEATGVVTHFTETRPITTPNIRDDDGANQFPFDESLAGHGGFQPSQDYSPRGGVLNVWLTQRPYVGQNASIYIALLNDAGEMGGAPIEINLKNPSGVSFTPAGDPQPATTFQWNRQSHLATFRHGDYFIAVDKSGAPMKRRPLNRPDLEGFPHPCDRDSCAVFDDQVMHYVDAGSMSKNWVSSWGDITDYLRVITATRFGDYWGYVKSPGTRPISDTALDHHGEPIEDPKNPGNDNANIQWANYFGFEDGDSNNLGKYSYLLRPAGEATSVPKAFREGSSYVYKVNAPSVLNQDIVFADYYVEHRRNATQISILPDKFGPFVYVEGSTLVRRASDGKDLPAAFVIPKFKITTELTFTMAASGDPGTFNFQGDAYPDFSKFDLTRRVLADIQIINESDNFISGDPTDYRRFKNVNSEEEYLWKDPSISAHSNIDYSDTITYEPEEGGPATITPGKGLISQAEVSQSQPPIPGGGSRLSSLGWRAAFDTEMSDTTYVPAVNLNFARQRIEVPFWTNSLEFVVSAAVPNTTVSMARQDPSATPESYTFVGTAITFEPRSFLPGQISIFEITVAAPNFAPMTYEIEVRRAAAQEANISDIELEGTDFEFDSDVTIQTLRVPATTSNLTVNVTPTAPNSSMPSMPTRVFIAGEQRPVSAGGVATANIVLADAGFATGFIVRVEGDHFLAVQYKFKIIRERPVTP